MDDTITSQMEIPKAFQEREYQTRILAKLMQGWKDGLNSQLVVSPTGSGKSVLGLKGAAQIIERAAELFGCEPQEVGVGWVAMRTKLLSQAKDENKMVGIKNIHYISMFDTDVKRHLGKYKYKILVGDEFHHFACSTGASLIEDVKPDYIIGLSATPIRTDKMNLCVQRDITDAGYHRLIQEGWLSKFDHYSIMGDWNPENVANHYLKDPKKWGQSVMFFLSKELCDRCVKVLVDGGVKAEVVTGQTDVERQCEDLESGALQVLVNMVMLTEGYDYSAMQTVWVRDSANRGPTVQMSGRVLRLHKGADGKPMVKNIVQSLETKFPFLRVAAARTQIVEVEGVWKTIGINDKMQRMAAIMANRLSLRLGKEDTVHQYLLMNQQGTKWRDDELIAESGKVEVMAHVHAALFANIDLLSSPDGKEKARRPQSEVKGSIEVNHDIVVL